MEGREGSSKSQDTRSVEELLSFIGDNQRQEAAAKGRPKKKKGKKKQDGGDKAGELDTAMQRQASNPGVWAVELAR